MAGIKGHKLSLRDFVEHGCKSLMKAVDRIGEENPKFSDEDAEKFGDLLNAATIFLSMHPATYNDENFSNDFDMTSNASKEIEKVNANNLISLAEQFENPDNNILVSVENDGELLDKVSVAFVRAAEALREVAEITAILEPGPEPITEQKLEEMAAVAEAFAESDDEILQKQAAVLDDILFTLASPKNAFLFSNGANDGDRIEQLKKKYNETREKQLEWNKVSEAVKEIEKSPVYKEYRTLEQPLSTRTCIDHPGVSVHRIGEHTVRCPLDGKTYNWDEGFETQKGNKVPGGDVANQSSFDQGTHNFSTFDSRSTRMGYSQGE